MRRRQGAVIVLLVATPASRACQAVVVVDVACSALLVRVQTHQREARGGVVERGAVPIHGGMATRAILRESAGFVWRVVRAIVVSLVTVPARQPAVCGMPRQQQLQSDQRSLLELSPD